MGYATLWAEQKPNKNGYVSLKVEYRHNSKQVRFNIDYVVKIPFGSFSPKEGILIKNINTSFKGIVHKKEVFYTFPNLKPLTQQQIKLYTEKANDLIKALNQIEDDLMKEGKEVSIKTVKERFDKKDDYESQKRATQNKSLINWYEEFIYHKEHISKMGGGLKSYKSTLSHLKDFKKSDYGEHLSFDLQALNRNFFNKFLEYLYEETDVNKASTIHKQFKNLKICINWILDDHDVVINSAYRKIDIKVVYPRPMGLSYQEFKELFTFDLSNYPNLSKTRDAFIFGIVIGGVRHKDLRQIYLDSLDYKKIYKDDDGLTKIDYVESKTGLKHDGVIINDFGLEILERNKQSKSISNIPFVPTNQRMNQNLKSIARLMKWNKLKVIEFYDINGNHQKEKDIKEPLRNIISTKMMRKTKVTIDSYLGVSPLESMNDTGHQTFNAFKRYYDPTKESKLKVRDKWNKFKRKYA